jgi:anti-anti-sigma factor
MSDQRVTEVLPNEHALHVVVLKASLDNRSTEILVDDVMTEAGKRPAVPIVIDFGKVKFAPSVALGALVQLTKSFTFDRRRIVLIGVDRRVMGAIRVTQLDRLLEIRDRIEDVVGPDDAS